MDPTELPLDASQPPSGMTPRDYMDCLARIIMDLFSVPLLHLIRWAWYHRYSTHDDRVRVWSNSPFHGDLMLHSVSKFGVNVVKFMFQHKSNKVFSPFNVKAGDSLSTPDKPVLRPGDIFEVEVATHPSRLRCCVKSIGKAKPDQGFPITVKEKVFLFSDSEAVDYQRHALPVFFRDSAFYARQTSGGSTLGKYKNVRKNIAEGNLDKLDMTALAFILLNSGHDGLSCKREASG